MDNQGMLNPASRVRRLVLGCMLTLIASGSIALAQETVAIRDPVRLTAGPSSELMGVVRDDASALYFISDASATLDLMIQAPINSGPRSLSSGLGDIAWPQISPSNKHVAYISFERDATGDVCVRSLSGSTVGDEKCLTGSDSAELQVIWWDDSSLAVLSRQALHGDYLLRKIPLGGGKAQTLLSRNMVGLALSPDREWLAYIPVEKRDADGVGITFSNRTASGVHFHRLGKKQKTIVFNPRLPGVTGYLAFSQDGKHLYFTQYLNDTNRNGVIDGDDNGVIFRVKFDGKRVRAIGKKEPAQLTSAQWDCHYPSPAKKQLITTCSHDGSLDVYSLDLEGAVPSDWNSARVSAEIGSARDLWSKLLLWARQLTLVKSEAARQQIFREMMSLHLELREYEAAIYYAVTRAKQSKTLTWADAIAELARHRRVDLALIRGQLSQQYVRSERARAKALRDRLAEATPAVAALARLVISEIEDDVGDKTEALTTFKQVEVAAIKDPLLAPLVADRAERLYRLRGDRRSLLGIYLALSTLATLEMADRLRYAKRFVDELSRGVKTSERAQAIAVWRGQIDEKSELALLLDVETALLDLGDGTQEEVRKAIFAMYRKNKDLDRRRALVLSTLQASAKLGNEYMQYQFSKSWASWLRREHPERKYAEEIYREIVLDRAYGEGAQGAIDESRGYFYGATLSAQSLEGHIGFIEARIAEGRATKVASLDEVYAKRFEREPDSPEYAFVRAYRIARELPQEKNAELHERNVKRAIELLEVVFKALPKEAQVHQLWGFVLHQRARRMGSRSAAVNANRQYLLALDLARGDERLTASLLHRLGLLQASLGNHRLALKYLLQRDRLPHVRPRAELGLRVAIARSAWHADEPLVAKEQMLLGQALLDKSKALRKYKPLILDRLALSLSAAGDNEAARLRYNELAGIQQDDPRAKARNRLKANIGLAVSAIESGESEAAIKAIAEAERLVNKSDAVDSETDVVWRESLINDYRYSRDQYRALVTGLKARAHRRAGDERKALKATQERVALIEERLKASKTDEDRVALAQAYHQLGELHYRLRELPQARVAIERGLELSAAFNKNTGSTVNDAGLALLQAYAELHLYGGVKLSQFKHDLREEVSRAYIFICKYRSPRWARQRFLFEIYLTMLSL